MDSVNSPQWMSILAGKGLARQQFKDNQGILTWDNYPGLLFKSWTFASSGLEGYREGKDEESEGY